MQSQPPAQTRRLHVAVIMDGNGRWATARGLPRTAGHRAGAEALRHLAPAALDHGIGTLTLYAFSSDNWARPRAEVTALLRLFERTLGAEAERCVERGVRLNAIGRRDRLPAGLRRAIERAEERTAGGGRLDLRIAIDYSARDAILRSVALAQEAGVDRPGPQRHRRTGAWRPAELPPQPAFPAREEFASLLAAAIHAPEPAPDVDLLIRTGGEQRLSDFLLWECAYAELYFTERLWPDFQVCDFEQALETFHRRNRRFGRLPGAGLAASDDGEPDQPAALEAVAG